MGRRVTEDDETLELPSGFDSDDGSVGLDEGDDLSALDEEEGSESVGLDTETFLVEDDGELDGEDELELSGEDDGLDILAEVDADGEEDGWIAESEGSSDVLHDETFFEDDDDPDDDDGGLEGVDDPGLDHISEDNVELDEGEDTLIEDFGDDLLREIASDG